MESIGNFRSELVEELWSSPSGLAWCRSHTESIDRVIQDIYRRVVNDVGEEPPLSLVATGGYGRHELAPYSDIDLCLIPQNEQHPALERIIRGLFQTIQREMHALGYRVGYSYRLISDIPGIDATTLSGLLDARLVAGNPQPLEALQEAVWSQFPVGEYLLAKIQERSVALRRTHETPLVVEPNLKEGAGGLRSFHTANWLRSAIGLRQTAPGKDYDTILRARNLLHAASGRMQDLLTRPKQAEICDRLDLDLFEWMGEVAASLVALDRMYRNSIDELREARYSLLPEVHAMRGELRVGPGASVGDAALGVTFAVQLGLHVPPMIGFASRRIDTGRVLQALQGGAQTIRSWADCGILVILIPELEACRTLLPRDATHQFTVYEHSVRAMENLDALAGDTGWLGGIWMSVQDTSALLIATALHDVGKIDPSEPHSQIGAEMAAKLCHRWSLDAVLAETVVWLVENHLAMAKTMRMRDLQNPETATEFAKWVGSEERLALLTLLTYADIRAVSSETWTSSAEEFLHDLWRQCQDIFDAGGAAHPAPEDLVRLAASRGSYSEEQISVFVESLPVHYALTTSPENIAQHLSLISQAQDAGPAVAIEDSNDRTRSDITVVTSDGPGLLGRILGVLYSFDLSLTSLRAHTTAQTPGMAIDVFTVSFGGRSIPRATAAEVARVLRLVVSGALSLDELMTSRGKDASRSQEIYRYQFVPGNPGILEVQAPRGRGMAFRMARMIATHGWEIQAARVGQWAGQGAAAFYVTGPGHRSLAAAEVQLAFASH